MSPWTLYWFNQFDIIRTMLLVFAALTSIAGILLLIIGSIEAHGYKLEDPRFIAAQSIRHFGFKLLPWALAFWILFTFIPSTVNACRLHPRCQLTTQPHP
jgi:hypothetical protein